MLPFSRRKFIEYSAAAMAVPLCPALMSCDNPPVSSGKTYLQSVIKVLSSVINKEESSFCEAANICADTIIGRKHCFLFTGFPAQTGYLDESTPGLPQIFINLRSQAMAETLKKGDTILATDSGIISEIALKLGARIIYITPISGTGEMSDSSEVFIRSHLPHPDGLVTHPDYTFSILPGYSLIRTVLVTALTGEIYRRSGGIGLTMDSTPKDAFGFIEVVIERLLLLNEQFEAVRRAGKLVADSLHAGGRFMVYDGDEALKTEFSQISGVPVFARTITREHILGGALNKGDVLLFGSLVSNDMTDLNLMREIISIAGDDAAITLCPHDETGGYRLFKESMITLDNLSPEKDGIMAFDNNTQHFLHTGGILNIALLWMLIGEVTDILSLQGKPPHYLMSSDLDGSQRHNSQARARAGQRGF